MGRIERWEGGINRKRRGRRGGMENRNKVTK
jgi:hypothetical protein